MMRYREMLRHTLMNAGGSIILGRMACRMACCTRRAREVSPARWTCVTWMRALRSLASGEGEPQITDDEDVGYQPGDRDRARPLGIRSAQCPMDQGDLADRRRDVAVGMPTARASREADGV
jgi:hypothetical protein